MQMCHGAMCPAWCIIDGVCESLRVQAPDVMCRGTCARLVAPGPRGGVCESLQVQAPNAICHGASRAVYVNHAPNVVSNCAPMSIGIESNGRWI